MHGLRALGPVGGLAVGIALLALAACASRGGESGGAAAPDDAPGSGGAAGVGGAAGKAGASGGTIVADATPSCDVGKLVYLSTIERKLLGFDPKTLAITPIGDIVCPASSSSVPFGLAIDVKGTLWIPYNNGAIYQLTLGDMSCKKSGYKPLQSGWERFKVAFLGDAASPTERRCTRRTYRRIRRRRRRRGWVASRPTSCSRRSRTTARRSPTSLRRSRAGVTGICSRSSSEAPGGSWPRSIPRRPR